jgi:hypothetical protein
VGEENKRIEERRENKDKIEVDSKKGEKRKIKRYKE